MAAFAGAFYISVQKEGQVLIHATKQMHEDYRVKPEWVLGQYAANKIGFDIACYHIVKQVQNAKKNVGGPAVRQGLDEGPGGEGRAGACVAKGGGQF